MAPLGNPIHQMLRGGIVFVLGAMLAWGATVRLYLKDGTYQSAREYQVLQDRVRYLSTERGEWEEIPLDLVDLKRTQAETADREQEIKKEAAEISAEEKVERQAREERERVPQEAGIYWHAGDKVEALKQAESKVVTNKGRSVLKVIAPLPVISGKATVELPGEHAERKIAEPRPEFYVRISTEDHFGIVRMSAKKGVRVVQTLQIIPVSKEIQEQEDDIEIFRNQLEEGLYKIWPQKPLPPGEYAVVEYTRGKGNVQAWDFAVVPRP